MNRPFLRLATAAALAALAFAGCTQKVDPVVPQPEPKPVVPEWPKEATIVGRVSADGVGLGGVVVSDGYKFALTGSDGRYSIESKKKHGYVFVSIPSGYEVSSEGVIPKFFAYVGKYERDTVDFVLTKAEQRKYSVYLLGDIHLADKRRDLAQFESFAKDLNAMRADRKGFALTLGDMSWDAYWGGFDLTDYLKLMNKDFPGLQVFHTIGNHDHELGKEGDWFTAETYKQVIGPTYYSFNVGEVHFIVLDDILCRNTLDGTRSSWNEVDDDQMKWLQEDLSYVEKDTPIVLAMHAPLYSDSGKIYLYNGWELIKCFDGFESVYVFSGHTHDCYNNDYRKPGYIPVYESNSGAVCAAWWYTVYDFPEENVHISTDGSPGGYRLLEVDGKDLKWSFKATGRDLSYQMRTYDRNSICLSADKYVPKASAANRKGFERLAADYVKPSTDNYVLMNIWDYDDNWDITVKENGKALKVERLSGVLDPLYLASFEAYSFNNGYTTEYTPGTLSSYYPSSATNHIFRVKASSATSTLEISATDGFGRTYTETMKRPKEFKLEY